MLISLNWIRQFCPFETEETPVQLGARFSLHAAEVEDARLRCGNLAEVVAATVQAVRPHPDADRLSLVTVDVGGGKELEVVCGAPGVRKGRVVPYAAPGVVVAGREIQEAKVRGVVSRGMLCSEKELDVSAEGAGLWELPADVSAGTPLAQLFPDLLDVVLEVDNKSLTHRPDLWGHHGLAREFSAIYHIPLESLGVDEELARATGTSAIRVSIVGEGVPGQTAPCRRYCGLQIDGVKVGPSPVWLRQRLFAIGARPINNIVDITNYVLFELGQPLHAFDTTLLGGGEIRVRQAASGESLELLDDTTVKLEASDLVIADASSAVALAGVLGGSDSQITDATTSIFLESANFAPSGVRKTSVRLGKRTDSSLRFEKSLDPVNARVGILRAAKMVLDLCPGARLVGTLQDVGFEPPAPIEVRTSAGFLTRRLGTTMEAKSVRGILERLGFGVSGEDSAEWNVRVPTWRATKDVSIQEDLVEEVGRIHGYDNIRPYAPEWTVEAAPTNEHRRFERQAKQFLCLHAGLSEVYTYSMVGGGHCRLFGLDAEAHLKLQNPVSEDMDRLRREIVPIHLEKARDNQKNLERFGFFEIGRVYRKSKERLKEPELPDEGTRIAGILSFEEKRESNFYQLRHTVLTLLEWLRIASVSLADAESPPEAWAHPAVFARVLAGEKECGRFYRVHPAVEARLELAGDVLAFDLDLDALFESPRREVSYSPASRYPGVPFDVTVVASERVPVGDIRQVIRVAAGELLVSAVVSSIYRSDQLGTGKKSVAFQLVFGSKERTLSGEERSAVEEGVMEALKQAGYPLR
jgi:phenylalanyl-tRNA synthetase beta chain